MTTWIKVEDQLPEPSIKVLATYVNGCGKRRRIIAIWVPKHTRQDSADDDFELDCDDDGELWWPEGWYEQIDNWGDYSDITVNEGEVTHWMPLPAPPSDEP